MIPQIHYAMCGEVSIAYQVVGNGPRDLIIVPGWMSNIEVFWEEPAVARFLRRLASFSRLILFDKRGTGLSDRVATIPDMETRMAISYRKRNARFTSEHCESYGLGRM